MRYLVIAAFAWWLAALAAPRHAGADPAAQEWIVVAADDPAFRGALVDALAPAHMTVIVVADQTAPSLGDLSNASRALAEREHATATVWLMPAAGGATLVTYDRDRDRLLIRELPFPLPLSPFEAAEAAHTARTMLRALRVTPDDDKPPPLAVDAPAIRETAAVRDRPLLAAGGVLGMRARAPATDVGGALMVIWRPDALGIALIGELSPSTDLRGAFDGEAIDAAVAVLARWPLKLGDLPYVGGRLRVTPMAGVAVHFVRLSGELGGELDSMQRLHGTRLDPAARAGVAVTYRLGGGLDVGVQASADVLVQRQRYVVVTEEVLEIPRAQAMIGAVATFWIW